MQATLVVTTDLTAKPSPSGGCLTAFGHSSPGVDVQGWSFNVWGTGGPLQDWIVQLFSGQKSTQAEQMLQQQVAQQGDTMLAQKLGHVSVFDRMQTVTMLGQPVAVHLCAADVQKVGTALVARVAASATGTGMTAAPGAPQIDGAAVTPAAHELVLDANLVAQVIFAAWTQGGLTKMAPDIDVTVLEALVPALATAYPNATTAQVTFDGELPPIVRATAGAGGELAIELGDVMIDVSIQGDRVFRFGIDLTLAVNLVPTGGALQPKVVGTMSRVAMLDAMFDGPTDAIEQGVAFQLSTTAPELLGSNAAIELPQLPGLGMPTAVTADAGGRYLHVALH
jgi:hypothetical protein